MMRFGGRQEAANPSLKQTEVRVMKNEWLIARNRIAAYHRCNHSVSAFERYQLWNEFSQRDDNDLVNTTY